jgi:hypothetical protein
MLRGYKDKMQRHYPDKQAEDEEAEDATTRGHWDGKRWLRQSVRKHLKARRRAVERRRQKEKVRHGV